MLLYKSELCVCVSFWCVEEHTAHKSTSDSVSVSGDLNDQWSWGWCVYKTQLLPWNRLGIFLWSHFYRQLCKNITRFHAHICLCSLSLAWQLCLPCTFQRTVNVVWRCQWLAETLAFYPAGSSVTVGTSHFGWYLSPTAWWVGRRLFHRRGWDGRDVREMGQYNPLLSFQIMDFLTSERETDMP